MLTIAARSEPGKITRQLALELGKVTGYHGDVEVLQDRFLGFAIKQEFERSAPAPACPPSISCKYLA
jgi:hypothetical protein